MDTESMQQVVQSDVEETPGKQQRLPSGVYRGLGVG